MSTDPTTRPSRLRDALRGRADEFLERCIACGRCYEACPMTRHAAVRDDAATVVAGVLDLLRGREAHPAALAWTKVCTKSALCTPACPEGLDAMLMVRLGKVASFGQLGGPAQATPREDPLYFPRIHAFARLQLVPEEQKQWTR